MMPENENQNSALTTEEYIYLTASDFLYYVFLVFDDEVGKYHLDVRDKIDYDIVERQSNWWWSLAYPILEWALDEWLEHQSRLNDRKYDYAKSMLSDSTSDFFAIAEQRLIAATRRSSGHLDWEADKRVPVALYLYYCGWLFYVLHTFQEIHRELTSTAPRMTARFDPIREEYRQLLEVLQGELQSIGTIVGIDETTAKQVRADVEAVGKELAEDWRQAVYETAKQIQAEE